MESRGPRRLIGPVQRTGGSSGQVGLSAVQSDILVELLCGSGSPLRINSHSCHLMVQLLECVLHGNALKTPQQLQLA